MKFNNPDIIHKHILQSTQIGIITHNNPDGDAIGSCMALHLSLKKLGKSSHVILPNAHPSFLQWMKYNEEIIISNEEKDYALQILNKCDLLIMLDFNVLDRTDWLKPHLSVLKTKKILIDHHPKPSNEFDFIVSYPEISSTAELLFHIFRALNWTDLIDRDIAECFYAGILTDTGSFNFNSSNPELFDVVSVLLKKGVRKDFVFSTIYNNYSFDRMRLLGLALNQRMTYFPEYNAAYIALTKDDLEAYDFQTGDTEGFVNYPLSIKNVRFTALFLEKPEEVKISFRSTGDFPANEFAANHFNGGGHKNAAGGNSHLNLDESVQKFVQLLSVYKTQLNS
jgi:bifunctional oligoribonuclease and PAP phosphatase NrnA